MKFLKNIDWISFLTFYAVGGLVVIVMPAEWELYHYTAYVGVMVLMGITSVRNYTQGLAKGGEIVKEVWGLK